MANSMDVSEIDDFGEADFLDPGIFGGEKSASGSVLGTVELAEAILACLPFRDLLLAQRVSKDFRDIIQSSVTIRQKLHLAPIEAHYESYWTSVPLLPDIFPYMEVKDTPNPKACKEFTAELHLGPLFRGYTGVDTDTGSEESWRKMFVTQPPIKRLCFSSIAWSYGMIDYGRDEGVTMGALVDAAMKFNIRHIEADGMPDDAFEGVFDFFRGHCEGCDAIDRWLKDSGKE